MLAAASKESIVESLSADDRFRVWEFGCGIQKNKHAFAALPQSRPSPRCLGRDTARGCKPGETTEAPAIQSVSQPVSQPVYHPITGAFNGTLGDNDSGAAKSQTLSKEGRHWTHVQYSL
jgi:hypothetical protein